MSSHVISIDIDVYSVFAVIFNILCLEVADDSMRLLYWHLRYIYDLILYLCLGIMYYTVCYLTGIFYAVVRQISVLFIDNEISVFCRVGMVCVHRSIMGWGGGVSKVFNNYDVCIKNNGLSRLVHTYIT